MRYKATCSDKFHKNGAMHYTYMHRQIHTCAVPVLYDYFTRKYGQLQVKLYTFFNPGTKSKQRWRVSSHYRCFTMGKVPYTMCNNNQAR